jgi:hypothetical protein
MATWTAAQLATAVCKRLGVVGLGQTAPAAYTSAVTDAYNSIYPQLRRHGLAPWASGAIEEEAQEPLSRYVAGEVASRFGLTGGTLAEYKADGIRGWQQLQEQASGDRTSLPSRPIYF